MEGGIVEVLIELSTITSQPVSVQVNTMDESAIGMYMCAFLIG